MTIEPEIALYWRYIHSSVSRLLDCLDGLDESALNWKPIDSANSLYVLATHTMGNLEGNCLGFCAPSRSSETVPRSSRRAAGRPSYCSNGG